MASYASKRVHGRTYTLVGVPCWTIGGRRGPEPYVEYRVEERRADGSFVGYLAFGDRPFVQAVFDRIGAGAREDRKRAREAARLEAEYEEMEEAAWDYWNAPRGCLCPDDCSCRKPWRPNLCGCTAHEGKGEVCAASSL